MQGYVCNWLFLEIWVNGWGYITAKGTNKNGILCSIALKILCSSALNIPLAIPWQGKCNCTFSSQIPVFSSCHLSCLATYFLCRDFPTQLSGRIQMKTSQPNSFSNIFFFLIEWCSNSNPSSYYFPYHLQINGDPGLKGESRVWTSGSMNFIWR